MTDAFPYPSDRDVDLDRPMLVIHRPLVSPAEVVRLKAAADSRAYRAKVKARRGNRCK
jgi:hypothetical protein